jgi:sodium/hydrogen antiporter
VLDVTFVVTGTLALAIAASARWFERLPLSGPLVALLTGVALGPAGLGVLRLIPSGPSPLLGDVARVTVAVSLMAVALRYPVRRLRERTRPLAWLLIVVLPAMAATTAVLAGAVLAVPLGLALCLGAALAPTDPVLASTVIGSDAAERVVPDRMRQDLSVESGANDGLAAPFVIMAAAAATATSAGSAALSSLWQVAGAILLGGAVGGIAGAALTAAERHRTIDQTHLATFSLVLALTTLGAAAVARTDDLLAVFAAGLVLNALIGREDRRTEELIDQSVHEVLILPLFLLFGAVLPWSTWTEIGPAGLLFTTVVLLVRRLPWVLAVRRPLHASGAEAVWFGWFGPIGVAATVYLVHLHELGVTDPVVWGAGSLVVAASTVVHGVTAAPGVWWLERAAARRPHQAPSVRSAGEVRTPDVPPRRNERT